MHTFFLNCLIARAENIAFFIILDKKVEFFVRMNIWISLNFREFKYNVITQQVTIHLNVIVIAKQIGNIILAI